jgi:hypothetical protein
MAADQVFLGERIYLAWPVSTVMADVWFSRWFSRPGPKSQMHGSEVAASER